jgi:hypothetical protein
MCSILSTRWVPNGYEHPSGMGAGKVSYPRVRVWVEFCTHQLYGYGYGIALPCPYPTHCHPYSDCIIFGLKVRIIMSFMFSTLSANFASALDIIQYIVFVKLTIGMSTQNHPI